MNDTAPRYPSALLDRAVPRQRSPRELPANVRLLHAPQPAAPVAGTQGTLALTIDRSLTTAPPRPRLVPTQPHALGRDTERWMATYLQAAIEVAHGLRPSAQLVRHTALEIHGVLARRGARAQHAARQLALGRTAGDRSRREKEPRPTLAGLFAVPTGEEAIEVAARYWAGERQRALAARFERRGARWICVALDFA